MVSLSAREPVILATDFDALVEWYQRALGFRVVRRFEDRFRYCNLETSAGARLGIAAAEEMGVTPGDRSRSTVLLQFQVEDVAEFLERLREQGGAVTFGPSYDPEDRFWFGGFADPEGNPSWVVDARCP